MPFNPGDRVFVRTERMRFGPFTVMGARKSGNVWVKAYSLRANFRPEGGELTGTRAWDGTRLTHAEDDQSK